MSHVLLFSLSCVSCLVRNEKCEGGVMSKKSREFTKALSLDQICEDLDPIHVIFIRIFMHNECMQVNVMVQFITEESQFSRRFYYSLTY